MQSRLNNQNELVMELCQIITKKLIFLIEVRVIIFGGVIWEKIEVCQMA